MQANFQASSVHVQFRLQFEDQLHFFVEECDHLQGFQLLADVHSGGFAAVASGLAQLLHDDVGIKSLLTVGTCPTRLEEEEVSLPSDDDLFISRNVSFWFCCSI